LIYGLSEKYLSDFMKKLKNAATPVTVRTTNNTSNMLSMLDGKPSNLKFKANPYTKNNIKENIQIRKEPIIFLGK
jgi:hypothetical protein